MHCILVIPAYRPPNNLCDFVKNLNQKGFNDIILVDDGSGEAYQSIFQNATKSGVTVLRHSKNQGKGNALKTAFHHCLNDNINPDFIITADCDGQHEIDDILKLFYTIKTDSESIFLGTRNFRQNVPLRSRFGNNAAAILMKGLHHIHLGDTQTGLRAFPGSLLPWLVTIPGKRYEYETNVLISAAKQHFPVKTVTVKTIYAEHNATSHYRPIRDSLRVTASMLPHFRRK